MNNEIREEDHEWVKTFHSGIDRLLVPIEKPFESRHSCAFTYELLIDKEVARILKVSRIALQNYRYSGTLSYIQVAVKSSTAPPMCNEPLCVDSRRRIDCEIAGNRISEKCVNFATMFAIPDITFA